MEEQSNQPIFDPENPLNAIKENPGMQVALFASLWLLGGVLGTLLAQAVGQLVGVRDIQDLIEGLKVGEYLEHLNTLKVLNIISHLCMYTLPVVVFVMMLYPRKKWDYLYLNKPPQAKNILLCFVMVLVIFPCISFLYYWNAQLIPKAAIAQDTLDMQQLFLNMKTPTDLILNLIMVGLVAGIGEELFFRGIIQRFLTLWTKNIHIGAILTGIIFSCMHGQAEGFVPRFVLGTLFCYFLIITGNLWLTMLVHIFFNSIQVLIPYFKPDLLGNMNEIEEVSLLIALPSLVGFSIIFFIFRKINPQNKYI